MERLLPEEAIPSSLWDSQQSAILLPSVLADAYRNRINELGLSDLSDRRAGEKSPIGGLSEESAKDHFAKAFDGSAARAQLTLMDIQNALGAVSDTLVLHLAGEESCLVDVPCGACSSSLSLLATVYELRRQEVFPRVPLQVRLLGGEISEYARSLARSMLEKVSPLLEEQAIYVSTEISPWDVLNKNSNVCFIQLMNDQVKGKNSLVVLVSNFSGFLEKEKQRKLAIPQIEELFRHASTHHNGVAIWIEPNTNETVKSGGLFPSLHSMITSTWKSFVSVFVEDGTEEAKPVRSSTSHFVDPLDGRRRRVGVAVERMQLKMQLESEK